MSDMDDPMADLGDQFDQASRSIDQSEIESKGDEMEQEEAADESTINDPPFEHADVEQKSVYPRPETWAIHGKTRHDAEGAAMEHGITNLRKMEVDDAALTVLREHTDEVIDLVLERRGIQTETDE